MCNTWTILLHPYTIGCDGKRYDCDGRIYVAFGTLRQAHSIFVMVP